MTARQSASASRASGWSRVIPAQLTIAPAGPSSSSACRNQAVTWAASVTSTSAAATRTPSSQTACSTWRAACSSRWWQKLMSQPSAASLRTVAAPIPREPPLTRATRRSSGFNASPSSHAKQRHHGLASILVTRSYISIMKTNGK